MPIPGDHLSLSRLIMLVLKSVKKSLSERVREMGANLSFEHIRLLHVIYEFNEPVQQELSNHLLTDKSLLLRQLLVLQKQGFLMRIQDGTDKRKKRVMLTTRGLELVKKTAEIRGSVIDSYLDGVSPERREVFYGVLLDMYKNALAKTK